MALSMTLVVSDDRPYEYGFDYASPGIAIKVADWAESIPDKRLTSIKSLFIDGWCESSIVLSAELAAAMKFHRPKDGDVLYTIRHVQEKIGIGVTGQEVFIEE